MQLLGSYNKRIGRFVSVDESAGCAPLLHAVTGIGEIMQCGTCRIKQAIFCISLP
jgi:hypothetical protein